MEIIKIILIGCLIVSVFDALGAILSRILKFKYALLIFGSIIIYGAVAFYVMKIEEILIGAIASGIVGVFDAIIGSIISKKLKANIPEKELANMKVTPPMVISVGVFAAFVGFITGIIFG